MGMLNVFRYLGLMMEAADKYGEIREEINRARDEDSPGGKEITKEEILELVENLDDEFSDIITRVCQECDIPVKSVNVTIEVEPLS